MSNIEWTDSTWNPVIGCRHVAEGCRHCYAETMSKRLAAMGQKDYASILDAKGKFNGRAITRPETLAEPLRWKKPRRVFVNSMSDLFHEDVPFEFIAAVFGVMAACPQHTFQVLTKRPERALAFFEWLEVEGHVDQLEVDVCVQAAHEYPHVVAAHKDWIHVCEGEPPDWPLKNVWLGASASTQKEAERNAEMLFKCPATIRFLSLEPLIERIDIGNAVHYCLNRGAEPDGECRRIDWVIVGGESGPSARPFKWEWAQSLRDQCKSAGVAMFFKQAGGNPTRWNEWEKRDAPLFLTDRKGGDPTGWPEAMPREWPNTEASHA